MSSPDIPDLTPKQAFAALQASVFVVFPSARLKPAAAWPRAQTGRELRSTMLAAALATSSNGHRWILP